MDVQRQLQGSLPGLWPTRGLPHATMVCALACDMAKDGDKINPDNQRVVKATPTKRKGAMKDQDYCDLGFHNFWQYV